MDWIIETLNAAVDAEIDDLPKELKPHFARTMALVEQVGLERMGMPHVRHLRGPIWEIRFRGKSAIGRALYVTLVKKTQKTPPREIALALKRMEALQA
jgi:phage-related protein